MLSLCLWSICCVGILLNALVFRKYSSFRGCYSSSPSSPSSVRSSLQLLCAMAAADTLSLLALILALGSHYLPSKKVSTVFVVSVCKLDIFLIHVASAFSNWCWLLLSGLRFLAVAHPYAHLRLNRRPLPLLAFVAFGCFLLEAWILFDVSYLKEARACVETFPDELGKIMQLAEIIWTYFVPLSLIIVLDLTVLCCHSARFKRCDLPRASLSLRGTWDNGGWGDVSSDVGVRSPSASVSPNNGKSPGAFVRPPFHSDTPLTNQTQSLENRFLLRRRTQNLRILRQCVFISVIDLLMNLPNYLVRLYLSLASDGALEKASQNKTFLWLQDFSQLLYFAQFSMNALYLVAINYVLPSHRKLRRKETENAIIAICAQQQQENVAITPRNYKRS